MRIFLTLITILFLGSFVLGQNKDLSILQKGLFIENSNILISWKSRLADTALIGRPKINKTSERNLEANWDTVNILDNLRLPLKAYFRMVHGDWHLIHFYSFLDSVNIDLIKNHLDYYLRRAGILKGQKKKAFFYKWKIYDCMIRLGRFPQDQKFEPFSDRYYLWLQRL